MRRVVLAWVSAWTVVSHPLSHADVAADWNRIALDAASRSDQRPAYHLNTMARVNVAMFEAVNFVRARYRPHFIVDSPGSQGMSMEILAATAAHYVLVNAYPNEKAALDAELRVYSAGLPPDPAGSSTIAAGRSIAAIIDVAAPAPERGAGGPWIAGQKTGGTRGPRSIADPLSLSALITELIAAKALALEESARIHALTSIVAAEAQFISLQEPGRCAPCIAAAAVAQILEPRLGESGLDIKALRTDREIGQALARSALRQYYRPRHAP